MECKKSNIYNENDISFDQKPYSENYPYNMVKMAAVEPVCFYPNRNYVNEFNKRKLNMKKLTDYIYEKNKETTTVKIIKKRKQQKDTENDKLKENDIIFKIFQPYYLPEYYNSTMVNQKPLINISPAKRIHESKKHYEYYEKFHYEEPAWTQAEKDLFNLLYKAIGKNFHKMSKEFENRATTLIIPSSILKKSKINITDETQDNIMASVTPIPSSPIPNDEKFENNNEMDNSLNKKNDNNTLDELSKENDMICDEDNNSFPCQALPNLENKSIHILVQNLKDVNLMPRDNMIFPRSTSEIIHFYYKNKFKIPNWKSHKEIKLITKKNKNNSNKI